MGGADDVELQILAALLKDSDPSTRHTALDLLEARSDRRTSPATRDLLLEALRDTQWSIRNSAAYALKRAAIEPATVVPALQAAKRAERAFVRRFELGLLLEEVTRPFFPWRAWAMVPVILFIFLPYHLLIRPCLPQPVHLVLGAGLSVKNGRKAVRFLVAALDHPEPEIRRRAAKYLGWYGPKAKLALDRLKAATHDEDEGVRRAASDAVEALTGRS
jgi:HEAT repeat protein